MILLHRVWGDGMTIHEKWLGWDESTLNGFHPGLPKGYA